MAHVLLCDDTDTQIPLEPFLKHFGFIILISTLLSLTVIPALVDNVHTGLITLTLLALPMDIPSFNIPPAGLVVTPELVQLGFITRIFWAVYSPSVGSTKALILTPLPPVLTARKLYTSISVQPTSAIAAPTAPFAWLPMTLPQYIAPNPALS